MRASSTPYVFYTKKSQTAISLRLSAWKAVSYRGAFRRSHRNMLSKDSAEYF